MQTTESPVANLPLEDWIQEIVPNVFETMLGIQPFFDAEGVALPGPDGRITAFVGLGGDSVAGIVYVHFPGTLAEKVTAMMLGIGAGEKLSDHDVNDVAGELCNMVTGGIKSILSDSGFLCAMTAPAIIRGSSFSVEKLEQTRREVFIFDCGGEAIAIEIHLNSSNKRTA